jgi:hypothetical protein
MRSKADFIHARRDANLAQGGGNVADIVITWNEWPADSATDPVTGARSGTPVPRSQVVRGFVHYVQPAMTQVRQFAEIEVGDCIVDLPPDVPLEGKAEVAFVIAGQTWVQKDVNNGRLPQSWDALVGGRKLFRTVLLRLAT